MALIETRSFKEFFTTKVAGFFAQIGFLINSYSMIFKNVNHPDTENENFIFACYHSQQCGLYSIKNRDKLYSLISYSSDGDLIAAAGGRVGMRCVRGSSKRGGAGATLELIEKIKQGNSVAIAVDGPRGPIGVPKKGVIEIAKLTGKPIIPMAWYTKSPFILKLPTWDKLIMPVFLVNTVTLFGEPIYVPNDCSDENFKEIKFQLQEKLRTLNEDLRKNFDKYYKEGIQNKEKSKSVVKWF